MLRIGAKELPGYQLRYIYFIDKADRLRLTVPEIPFDMIKEIGASMYRGKSRASSVESGTSGFQSERGGESPTDALQLKGGT